MPLTTFTHDQSLARDGRVFDFEVLYPLGGELASLASAEVLIVTGDTGVHAIAVTKSVGTAEIRGYAGATVSANGTEIPPHNRNPRRAALNGYTPAVKAYSAPTVTDYGSEIHLDIVPAGATQGNASSGAEAGVDVGWYLEPNTGYLYTVKNVSGAAAIVLIHMIMHEAL